VGRIVGDGHNNSGNEDDEFFYVSVIQRLLQKTKDDVFKCLKVDIKVLGSIRGTF
jgi:hypothetical protein